MNIEKPSSVSGWANVKLVSKLLFNAALVLIAICVLAWGLMLYLGQRIDTDRTSNALKVKRNGESTVVRWPYAWVYQKGDTIHIPNEDASYTPAIVIQPVQVDSVLLDDEVNMLRDIQEKAQ